MATMKQYCSASSKNRQQGGQQRGNTTRHPLRSLISYIHQYKARAAIIFVFSPTNADGQESLAILHFILHPNLASSCLLLCLHSSPLVACYTVCNSAKQICLDLALVASKQFPFNEILASSCSQKESRRRSR